MSELHPYISPSVLLPLHKSIPSNRLGAFFYEGLENCVEKGRGTAKMFRDRESMFDTFVFCRQTV